MQRELFAFSSTVRPSRTASEADVRPLDLPTLLARVQAISARPRYAFMVLNLIAKASGTRGRAGPYVVDRGVRVPVRDWLCDALAPMAARAPTRVALVEQVRDDRGVAGLLPADRNAAHQMVEVEVRSRMRKTGRANVSRAVSDLVRAGLLQRHYQGHRVDHANRGAGRLAVYTIAAATLAALAGSMPQDETQAHGAFC
jgi:hypothetical protein